MSKKWTRAEVLEMASLMDERRFDIAAAMLRELAPPNESRQWKVGDLLRHGDHNCHIFEIDKGFAMLREINWEWRAWVSLSDLANATPLKLVADE